MTPTKSKPKGSEKPMTTTPTSQAIADVIAEIRRDCDDAIASANKAARDAEAETLPGDAAADRRQEFYSRGRIHQADLDITRLLNLRAQLDGQQ